MPIHRLSVEQYEQMTRVGILTEEDRVELLEGWLVPKRTRNPPHRIATRMVRVALEAVVPAGWYVDSQEPIVTEDSEPEPDVSVIRGRTEDYADRNPPAGAVGLVVEIGDATLALDRQLKARAYARAGIPVYWIVNLVDRSVEGFAAPSGPVDSPAYGRRVDTTGGFVPLVLDGEEVARIPIGYLLP